MDPMTAFLLSMQAAGLITSIFAANSQQKFIQMGRQLEQEQFETNMKALQLQSDEDTLAEIREVNKNIGSQIAINAARGTRGGNTAIWGINQSMKTFDTDERKRRLNLLANQSQLRASNVMSSFSALQSETQLGQSLTKDVLNAIPTTSLLSGKNKTSNGKKEPSLNSTEFFNWGI